jgi:hypothetical protein
LPGLTFADAILPLKLRDLQNRLTSSPAGGFTDNYSEPGLRVQKVAMGGVAHFPEFCRKGLNDEF